VRTPEWVMKLTRMSTCSQAANSRRSSVSSEGEPLPAVKSQGKARPVSGMAGLGERRWMDWRIWGGAESVSASSARLPRRCFRLTRRKLTRSSLAELLGAIAVQIVEDAGELGGERIREALGRVLGGEGLEAVGVRVVRAGDGIAEGVGEELVVEAVRQCHVRAEGPRPRRFG
jgi:hypothetical protein